MQNGQDRPIDLDTSVYGSEEYLMFQRYKHISRRNIAYVKKFYISNQINRGITHGSSWLAYFRSTSIHTRPLATLILLYLRLSSHKIGRGYEIENIKFCNQMKNSGQEVYMNDYLRRDRCTTKKSKTARSCGLAVPFSGKQ